MLQFKNIVVGVNVASHDRLLDRDRPGPISRLALERAANIAERSGGTLHIITSLEIGAHAEDMMRRDYESGGDSLQRRIEEHLESLAKPIRDRGIGVTVSVEFGSASRCLVQDALSNHRDLVVVGTHERGAIARNLMGSTALNLLRRCPVSVLVSRRGAEDDTRRILAVVDLDEAAKRVIEHAYTFARATESELHVLHVVDYSGARVLRMGDAEAEVIAEYRAKRRAEAEEELRELVAGAVGADLVPELHFDFGEDASLHVETGEIADAILATSKRLKADGVAMGTVVHGALSSILLGSTTEAVLAELDTSLLVVKIQQND